MAELNSAFGDLLVWMPGNPDYPTGLPGTSDPYALAALVDYPILSTPSISGPQGPDVGISSGPLSAFGGYSDWFLERFWIKPVPMDYGNIVSSKTIAMTVLSTHQADRALSSIDEATLSGFSVVRDDGGAIPRRIRFLEVITLSFTADFQGPAAFDAPIEFVFNSESFFVTFLGVRLVLFWFPPQRDVVEQLIWRTDIIESRSRTEQRRRLSRRPRQSFQYAPLLGDTREAAELRNLLKGLQGLNFGIPQWHDQRVTTAAASIGATTISVSTADADFAAGGTVMVFFADRTHMDLNILSVAANTLTTVDPLTKAIPAGTALMPVRFGFITKYPSISDPLYRAQHTQIQFESNDSSDVAYSDAEVTANFTLHPIDSIPVLTDPNFVDGDRLNQSHALQIAVSDAQRGLRAQFPLEDFVRLSHEKMIHTSTAAELWKWRRFLHWLAGSWKPFYMPTFRDDLPINTTYNLNSVTIVTKSVGNSYVNAPAQPHRDILIRVDDGRSFVRRVTTLVDNGNGTDTVTINSAPQGGSEILAASRVTVSWAILSRIEGDVATIRHRYPGNATITFLIKHVLQ